MQKNILIELSNGQTVLVHMKMTGHLLYGVYRFKPLNVKDPWEPISPPALKDPYNRYIRLILKLENGRYLALSDVRRFAKVTAVPTKTIPLSPHLSELGPEPLHPDFTLSEFKKRLLMRPRGKIKQVLMDQAVIAGIGNIYADETLWRAGIHPMQTAGDIGVSDLRKLYLAIRKTLARGIDFGGDSMSDYRNIHGEKGRYQENHKAYRKTGTVCEKSGCGGIIRRIVVGGRGTHFCDRHQILRVKQSVTHA